MKKVFLIFFALVVNFVDFLVQGGLVALGELAVMLTLGTILYYVMIKRNLDKRLFNQ